MTLEIPESSLVVLVGDAHSGRSAFARRHFLPEEILTEATGLRSRLAAGQLSVIDAPNLERGSRREFLLAAREFHRIAVVIGLDMLGTLGQLDDEGFRLVYLLKSPAEIEAAAIEREALSSNLKHEHGPFDIIGDIHGCFDELAELLARLGHGEKSGRKLVFLGDLVDRGPKIPDVVRFVMDSVKTGSALCVPGNHDMKLTRKMRGNNVQITHGLAESLAQFEAADQKHPNFSREAADFFESLASHLVLDDGKLVVAHAGMKEPYQGGASSAVHHFALFGETSDERDEYGLTIRHNWAADYRGEAIVVYGHTPVLDAEWVNRAIDIDTGCVFGGKLTALRYPEMELVSVPAKRAYAELRRPFVSLSVKN